MPMITVISEFYMKDGGLQLSSRC